MADGDAQGGIIGQQGVGGEVKPAAPAAPAFAVPDAYKGEKSLETVKNYDDLFKGYVESNKMIGRGIFLPDEKATPEQKTEALGKVYSKLGRPDDVKGYNAKLPDLPDGTGWGDDFVKAATELAFKLGLNNEQFAGLMSSYKDMIVGSQTSTRSGAVATEATLVKEWGKDVYKQRVAEGTAIARMYGGDKFLEWLDSTGVGNDRTMIEFLAKIGQEAREDGLIDESVLEGVKRSEDYMEEALVIMRDPKHPYRDARHPEHKMALERVESLIQRSTSKV